VTETPQQYQTRILALGDRGDPLTVLSSTAERLRAATRGRPADVLSRRPAPGRWSVHEIVVHLADAEVVFAYRLRMMIAAPGVRLQAFDQDGWANSMQYGRLDLAGALDRFDTLRRSNLELIANLKAPEQAFGLHAERGREDAALLLRLYAGHDLNHLTRIEAMVAELSP